MGDAGWSKLTPEHGFSPKTLAESLDGGQAFRWSQHEGIWLGVWQTQVVRIRWAPSGLLEFQSPTGASRTEVEAYLGLADPQLEWCDALPWRSDWRLAALVASWRGLRILRQDLAEVLLAFILSSNRGIPIIKQNLETLARRFGEPLPAGLSALPRWEVLAEVASDELRLCGLGYRAEYVSGTAQLLQHEPEFLKTLETLDFDSARAALMRLPGVGPKVADCVLLFGGAHYQAFPIDRWIERMLAGLYGLQGWPAAHMFKFAQLHFGPQAGLVQQMLFAEARSRPAE